MANGPRTARAHGGATALFGEVEAAETYVGEKRPGKRGRGAEGKTLAVGLRQRRGPAKARVTPDAKRRSPFIRANVRQGSVSDEWFACRNLGERGYRHETANHGGGQRDGPATTRSRATG